MYGLGSSNRLYTINLAIGTATQVGSGTFSTPLSGTEFGVDFNPVVDRLRVVSNTGQNLRLNPDTGTLTAVDTPLNPGTPSVAGVAYTNNFADAASTTLFGIDSSTDVLVMLGSPGGTPVSPNAGVITTIGALGVNTSDLTGFDISGATGIAFASLTAPGGGSSLYTINLTTGAATLVGTLGGGVSFRDISVVPAAIPEPATFGLLATGLAAMLTLRRRPT